MKALVSIMLLSLALATVDIGLKPIHETEEERYAFFKTLQLRSRLRAASINVPINNYEDAQ